MVKLSIMLMMVLFGLSFTIGNCQAADKSGVTVSSAKPVVKQTPKLKIAKLMDFGAEKCGSCQKLAPILAQMKQEYAGVMEVVFVDVWQKKNIATAQKYKIETIPTQIFFDATGKELWRHVGFISEQDMLKQFKKLGYDIKALKQAKLKEK